MNEQEWLTCTEPHKMREFLRGKASDRKLRLLGVACCRRIWHRLTDERSRQAVAATECHADGGVSKEELDATWDTAWAAAFDVWGEDRVTSGSTFDETKAAFKVCDAVANTDMYAGWDAESQAVFLREIFGNPFRPVAIDIAWLTPTVKSLATAAYEQRALPSGELDTARLAILADALEECGCDNAEILAHLRGPGPHVCGCWVVDLIPGRSKISEQPDRSAAQGALLVRLCWPRCHFWGGEWGFTCRDALWVECAAEAARKLVHPLLDPAAVERSEAFAEDPLSHGEPTQDGQPGLRFCFLISTDLRRIDPHPVCYPWAGLWNGACPFREVGEHRVNTLEAVAGILPRRPWWRFWG
jgi:hypothetical protein